MTKIRVGGHPDTGLKRYWRGGLLFPVKNEAQDDELWNGMSKEFRGNLAMMAFPREWNRASGRELHFRLSREDDNRYIELSAEVANLIMAYLSSGETVRAIFQSMYREILGSRKTR